MLYARNHQICGFLAQNNCKLIDLFKEWDSDKNGALDKGVSAALQTDILALVCTRASLNSCSLNTLSLSDHSCSVSASESIVDPRVAFI